MQNLIMQVPGHKNLAGKEVLLNEMPYYDTKASQN